MKGKFNVLMAYSEVAPFVKTGGLGDVGGALPKALKEMGHDVRVITPQYREINERRYILRDVIRLQNIEVPLGGRKIKVNVKSAFLPNTKVQVYFLHYKPFYFRSGLYVDPKTGTDYPDNDQRFVLFSYAILETLKKLQWQPDVIHCNDWQTALIPFLLKTYYRDDPFFRGTCSLLTIHNFAFQGVYKTDPHFLGLEDFSMLQDTLCGQNGEANFLKVGLFHADIFNTVSDTHVKEMLDPDKFDFGLNPILVKRKKDFFGVLNGIDDAVWSPENDSYITEPYNMKEPQGKAENKKALLEKLGFQAEPNVPVVAMISRLTDQKGMDLIRKGMDELLKLDLLFVILGVGDPEYHKFLKNVLKKHKNKISVHLDFDDTLAHQIIAGADIFLMPSRFEPCGLTQLYALKYGTIPVVHRIGGLADTIHPFDSATGRGNGFVFDKPDTRSLLTTLKRALKMYRNEKAWQKIMKNAMRQDFSWAVSARKYVKLYQKCVAKKKN